MSSRRLFEIDTGNIAPVAFAFECGLAVVAVAIGSLIDFSPLRTLNDLSVNQWREVLIGGVAAGPPFLFLIAMPRIRYQWARNLQAKVQQEILPMFAQAKRYELVAVSLAAGFSEELFFRGLLQDGLFQWNPTLTGAVISIAIAAIIFGGLHAVTRAYAVLATIMGAYLGILFWYTDSVLAAMFAHGTYDCLAFFWLMRNRRR